MNRKRSYRNESVTAADDEMDDAMLADAGKWLVKLNGWEIRIVSIGTSYQN